MPPVEQYERRIAELKASLVSMAATVERACGRLILYQDVVDAVYEMVDAYNTKDNERGPLACEALMEAVKKCPRSS